MGNAMDIIILWSSGWIKLQHENRSQKNKKSTKQCFSGKDNIIG